jgi:hypothetical protein
MTTTLASNPDAILDQVVSALKADDLEGAETILAGAPGAVPQHALMRLAELNLRRRRWRDAAWLFDRVADRDASAELKRYLCRNMACLERHRPEVHAQLSGLPLQQSHVTICPSATDRPTIGCRAADGAMVGFSAGNDPLAAMKSAMHQLRPTIDQGTPLAVCGMGDGYLVHALAADETERFQGMQQPVFVLEPDPHVALHCLMIHDYTGPHGPIEQERFRWFVGPAWADELEWRGAADPFMGLPSYVVGLGLESGAMRERLTAMSSAIVARDAEIRERLEQEYSTLGEGELAALFGTNPPRRPRVLLLTTRFSTVLQYSTRDTAEAFGRIGWDTRVLIEPTASHRLYQYGIRQTLDEFRPDLVFQIDHLRHEHGDLFPPGVPFACWIQDHLPSLQNPAAGKAVGSRDFVLTDMGPAYTARHGYPPEQIVALTKLTRLPHDARQGENITPSPVYPGETRAELAAARERARVRGLATAAPDGLPHPSQKAPHPNPLPCVQGRADQRDDLSFVSNASHNPSDLAERLLTTLQAPPAIQALARACGEQILATYSAGGCLSGYADVRDLVRRLSRGMGVPIDGASARQLASMLTHPLNDALYRQQGLTWAAEIAREQGLNLGLYGNGWEKHPTLGKYARGPVQYGRPLEDLTRRTVINLQIVPFSCLHQRLLDGLIAGGFFLIRDNPTDTRPRELLDFVHHHAPCAQSVAAVEAAIRADLRSEFSRLVASAADFLCDGDGEDPVACVAAWRDAGMLVPADDVLPYYGGVTFNDPQSLSALVRQYLAEPAKRQEIAAAQRASVVARFTYEAGMRRLVREIGRRIDLSANRNVAEVSQAQRAA